MARNTFGIGDLNAAAPGLSKLAAALVGGQGAYQAGFDGTVNAQSKIAQTLAEIRAQNSAAGAHDAQAENERAKTGVLAARPGLYNTQVANASGTDVPTVNGYLSQLQTGVAPQVPMGPPTEEGAMGVGSMVLPDATRSKIAGAIQQFLPLLANSGDLNPEQLAKASTEFGQQSRLQGILGGSLDRNKVAGAEAAIAAKPLFNTNGDGAVLDQYAGALDTANPMARATIGLRGAQAGEASARAGLARAQGKDAAAGKFDPNSGTIIDVSTGRATPVVDVTTGKPLGGKASGGLNQEQANALTFATRMRAADSILDGLAQSGVTQPGMIHRIAGSLPFVGDAAGSLTNGTQSQGQQEVEQAQRDFINAVLRRESGAAISTGEFANAAQQYFPQPGDKPGVLAQKAAARKRVTDLMFSAVPQSARPQADAAPTPGKPIVVDY